VIIRRHQQYEASANDCHPNEFPYEASYVNGRKCFLPQTANHIHRNMDQFPLFYKSSLAPSTSNLINRLLSDRFMNFVSDIALHTFQRTNYRRDPPDWGSLRFARHLSLKFGSISCQPGAVCNSYIRHFHLGLSGDIRPNASCLPLFVIKQRTQTKEPQTVRPSRCAYDLPVVTGIVSGARWRCT
jgi:hypothetical protein